MTTRSARWWLERLRAMSVAEVAHRTRRLATHAADLVRMRVGRYARIPDDVAGELARWRGPERFYFTPELARAPLAAALRDDADAICAGRREVLGLGWIDLPAMPWRDPRLTWELNRGHEWVLLARAFAATAEARYLDRLTAEITSWREQNPVGVGINWASAMEAAIRIHSLAWVAGLVRPADVPVLGTIAAMLYEHTVFVGDHLSEFSSANNHLIVELSGLVVAARVLGTVEVVGHRRRTALSRLEAELARQVFPDGVNAEMATHYHAFVLEALLLVATLEREHGAPRPELERVIAKMADYLVALRCADGGLLQQGDSDDGKIIGLMAAGYTDQLIAAARSRGAAGASTHAPRVDEEGAFLLTNGALRTGPPVLPVGSRHFDASGQVVLRSERLVAVFDAGPFGFGSLAAHGHCDSLAINAALDGRRFLVDRGTYRYNGDRTARDRYRMTAAHNTVQLGTREQADATGPFLWGRRPTVTIERCELGAAVEVVVASHDGFAPSRHRRTLVHHASMLVVIDEVTGSEAATSRFHFAPELEVSMVTGPEGCHLAARHVASGSSGGWIWLARSGPGRLHEQRHSDRYGAERPALTVECAVEQGVLIAIVGPGSFAELERPARELLRRAEELRSAAHAR